MVYTICTQITWLVVKISICSSVLDTILVLRVRIEICSNFSSSLWGFYGSNIVTSFFKICFNPFVGTFCIQSICPFRFVRSWTRLGDIWKFTPYLVSSQRLYYTCRLCCQIMFFFFGLLWNVIIFKPFGLENVYLIEENISNIKEISKSSLAVHIAFCNRAMISLW